MEWDGEQVDDEVDGTHTRLEWCAGDTPDGADTSTGGAAAAHGEHHRTPSYTQHHVAAQTRLRWGMDRAGVVVPPSTVGVAAASLCVSLGVCVCVGERVCERGDVGVHVSVRDTAHHTQSTTVHVITYYTTIQHSTPSQADESACTPCHASHSLYRITHTALHRITTLTHPRTFPRVPHKTSLGRRGLPSSCNAV